MIKRFGTLYAGQVELDGIGFDGPAANSRWYDNEHLIGALDTAEQLAVNMDRLGFDTLWLAEHHFQREGYECIPNILMLAVHLAHLTERLRFGCGFNIAPMWHPLRLAEDYAVADILTKGRIRFGLGRGLSHPGGRDLRRAHAGWGRQPGALRGAGRDNPEGLPGAGVLSPREALHAADKGALPGIRA